jgi:hypothetical protein
MLLDFTSRCETDHQKAASGSVTPARRILLEDEGGGKEQSFYTSAKPTCELS